MTAQKANSILAPHLSLSPPSTGGTYSERQGRFDKTSMWRRLRKIIFLNLGLKLFSFVLAMALYVNVLLHQEREMSIDIPLHVRGIPENLIGTGELPKFVKVKVRGLGLGLLNLRAEHTRPYLLVEVGSVLPGLYQRPLVTEDVFVPSDISVQVVEVVDPQGIAIDFDQLLERRLHVVPAITGRPAPGYIRFGREAVEPESILVRGPERRLRSFEFLRTEPVDITGRDGLVTRRVAIAAPSWCEVTPAGVMVQVMLEKVISRTFHDLSVEVHRGSGVTLVKLTPEAGSVSVSGPTSLVEQLAPDKLRLSIDARGLPPATYTLMASVELVGSGGEGAVSVEPVEPEKFEVILE